MPVPNGGSSCQVSRLCPCPPYINFFPQFFLHFLQKSQPPFLLLLQTFRVPSSMHWTDFYSQLFGNWCEISVLAFCMSPKNMFSTMFEVHQTVAWDCQQKRESERETGRRGGETGSRTEKEMLPTPQDYNGSVRFSLSTWQRFFTEPSMAAWKKKKASSAGRPLQKPCQISKNGWTMRIWIWENIVQIVRNESLGWATWWPFQNRILQKHVLLLLGICKREKKIFRTVCLRLQEQSSFVPLIAHIVSLVLIGT